MKDTMFYMYKNSSQGGKALKDVMGLKAISHENSTYEPSPDKTIINWGAGIFPAKFLTSFIINKPGAVCRSINKLAAFRAFSGICRIPDWTTNHATASRWVEDGHKVVCRHSIEGSEGQGIEIIDARAVNLPVGGNLREAWDLLTGWVNGRPEPNLRPLPRAALYTKFVRSEREYRVHVVDGDVIAVHRKVGGTNEEVRNSDGGWLFRRVSDYPRDICTQAMLAVRALGLDFAAVDVLWDGAAAYVLETNTAPGIDGMEWTIRQYALALERLIKK